MIGQRLLSQTGWGGFIYKAGFGVDMPKGTFVEFSMTSAANLLAGGGVEFTPDLSREETLLPLEKRLLDDGFLSHIRVPIAAKGEVRPPDLVEFVMIPIRKPVANLCPEILFLLN